jgi:DNA-binding beta-propeller fold protein YncE
LNQGTFLVGNAPVALAFDGVSMWITNAGDNTVTRLRSTDGVNMGTFPTGRVPIGIAFDGTNMWVTNNADTNGTVSKL